MDMTGLQGIDHPIPCMGHQSFPIRDLLFTSPGVNPTEVEIQRLCHPSAKKWKEFQRQMNVEKNRSHRLRSRSDMGHPSDAICAKNIEGRIKQGDHCKWIAWLFFTRCDL